MTIPHPDNLTPINDAADASQKPQGKPEYVSGREGLTIVRKAGIGIGPELWYRMLAKGELPGQVSLGRRYWVPDNIVELLANIDSPTN